MTVYSVYEPASDDDDIAARADRIAFVKDGFSWLALIFPMLWMLYYRMWIEFAVVMAVMFGLEWAFGAYPDGMQVAGWMSLAITVLFAFEANDLRGAMLERRGYRFTGVAMGRDRQEAERSFFTIWLQQQAQSARSIAPAPKTAPGAQASAPSRRGAGDDVIGLFPQG